MSKRKAFTLIELLVVVSIIALLVSILVPALGRARDQAKRVACMSQLRGVGQALVMYAHEYNDRWPYVYHTENILYSIYNGKLTKSYRA